MKIRFQRWGGRFHEFRSIGGDNLYHICAAGENFEYFILKTVDSFEFCMFLSGGLHISEYWGVLDQIIGGCAHPQHPPGFAPLLVPSELPDPCCQIWQIHKIDCWLSGGSASLLAITLSFYPQ